MSRLLKWLRKPARFDYLDKWLRKPGVKVLDVGCGNHSPTATKGYYPECFYYGLDRTKYYNNNDDDVRAMDGFFEFDLLSHISFDSIPDDFFDVIIMSHVIEHTHKGDEVVSGLSKKLKAGGIMYIEFPSRHSVYLPHMKGTLNFYDDPTHVRLYTLKEVRSYLKDNGCSVIKGRIRFNLKRVFLFPIYFIGWIFSKKGIQGGLFWDVTGFASYIIARKK